MKERSKSLMLLLEITVMILIFAFCAAVCLSLFASARRMSKEAEDSTSAAMWAQSTAEAYKSVGGDLQRTAALIGATVSGDTLELGLDGDWQVGGSEYTLRLTGDQGTAVITVSDKDGEFFSMDVKAVTYG